MPRVVRYENDRVAHVVRVGRLILVTVLALSAVAIVHRRHGDYAAADALWTPAFSLLILGLVMVDAGVRGRGERLACAD